MYSSQSTIRHRIVLSCNTGILTACTTLALDAPGSATERPAKRRQVRDRPAKKSKVASAARLAKKPLIRFQQLGRAQENYHSANSQWPNWPDPLDFQEVPVEEAIARINAAGYFITRNGDIYKIDPDGGVTAQRPGGFNNFFACRQARCDDGKLISASAAWRRSLKRREHEQIGYWPEDYGRPDKSYNLWQGWGVDPKPGNCTIIYDHILDVIADGDEEKAKYTLDWAAHTLQRPWEKPSVAIVLIGQKGTGKTLLTQILARVVGRKNALITADGKSLFGQFNWHVADKILIGAEEAFFGRDRALNDKLKHLLTGGEIEVEQKFGHRVSIKSLHRMIMTSNHADVVQMTADERRFFVCEVSDKRRGDHDYFVPLWRIADGRDDATLAAFMHDLKTRDITNWRPEHGARNVAAFHSSRQKLVSVSLLRRRASGETSVRRSMPHKKR
jgi:Family of unknown function (DUF5906)